MVSSISATDKPTVLIALFALLSASGILNAAFSLHSPGPGLLALAATVYGMSAAAVAVDMWRGSPWVHRWFLLWVAASLSSGIGVAVIARVELTKVSVFAAIWLCVVVLLGREVRSRSVRATRPERAVAGTS